MTRRGSKTPSLRVAPDLARCPERRRPRTNPTANRTWQLTSARTWFLCPGGGAAHQGHLRGGRAARQKSPPFMSMAGLASSINYPPRASGARGQLRPRLGDGTPKPAFFCGGFSKRRTDVPVLSALFREANVRPFLPADDPSRPPAYATWNVARVSARSPTFSCNPARGRSSHENARGSGSSILFKV